VRNEHFLSFYFSAVTTIFTFFYGPEYMVLTALLVFMTIDYITGILAAVISGVGLSSSFGFKGLLKKFATLCVIAVTHHIDLLLGTSMAMLGAVYFYSALELISIVENCGKMGVPLPKGLKNSIAMLKEKGEADGDYVESQVHGNEVSSDESK
jgi:toxin secretion/phage lysis holin